MAWTPPHPPQLIPSTHATSIILPNNTPQTCWHVHPHTHTVVGDSTTKQTCLSTYKGGGSCLSCLGTSTIPQLIPSTLTTKNMSPCNTPQTCWHVHIPHKRHCRRLMPKTHSAHTKGCWEWSAWPGHLHIPPSSSLPHTPPQSYYQTTHHKHVGMCTHTPTPLWETQPQNKHVCPHTRVGGLV